MNKYNQDIEKKHTDSRYISVSKLFDNTISTNEIESTNNYKYKAYSPINDNILRNITSLNIENSILKSSTSEFLKSLVSNLNIFHDLNTSIPPLKVTVDDDFVFFDWNFKNYIIGFNISEDERSSSYHLVQNRLDGQMINTSSLLKQDYNKRIKEAFSFIKNNT